MTLTRSQIHERLGSLSGEIKAAREMKRETEQALTDADKAVTLARQADEKSQAHIERLEAEARDLGHQYTESIAQLIAAPVADETAPNVTVEGLGGIDGALHLENHGHGLRIEGADFAFDTPERHAAAFGNNHYTNGIADAFDRATEPHD